MKLCINQSLLFFSTDKPIFKRQTNLLCYPESRSVCNHTFATSNFYDHCIEQIFPCHEEGFALKYAKKRAEILEREHEITPAFRGYLEKTETCFQEKFRALVNSRKTIYPDDESCLALETEAVALLNGCYQQPELCSLISEIDHSEIHSIVEAFRIGSHYHNGTLVDMGLPNAILETCSSNYTELAKSLTASKMPVRVVLCASSYDKFNGGPAFNETGYIEQLSIALNRPADQFTYLGDDSTTHLCSKLVIQDLELSVFAWFADPQDSFLNRSMEEFFIDEPSPVSYVRDEVYYFLHIQESRNDLRKPSQCGDGIRQIGETCDNKNNIGKGCTHECTVHDDFSCSTDTLSPSVCEPSKEVKPERIPCRSSPRRGSRVANSRLTMSSGSTQIEKLTSIEKTVYQSSSADCVRTSYSSFVILFAAIALYLSTRY